MGFKIWRYVLVEYTPNINYRFYTLLLIKNSQRVLKNHLLLLTLSPCWSIIMGHKLSPTERRQEGRKEMQLLQDVSTSLTLDMNSLCCEIFQTNIVCLQLGLCLKAEIHESHNGFLIGTVIPNYALMTEEEDTLIMENSVTDLYKLFINISF